MSVLLANPALFAAPMGIAASTIDVVPEAIMTLVGLEDDVQTEALEQIATELAAQSDTIELGTALRAEIPDFLNPNSEPTRMHFISRLKEHDALVQRVLRGMTVQTAIDEESDDLVLPFSHDIRAAFLGVRDFDVFAGHFELEHNPIEWLLRHEVATGLISEGEAQLAEQRLANILLEVDERLKADRAASGDIYEDPELTPQERLSTVYEVLDEWQLLGSKNGHKSLFTQNLLSGDLDCDDSCLVVLAIAFEYDWPVRLVPRRDHAILRYDDGRLTFNMDFGQILTDEHYQREDERPLQGLEEDEIYSLFYFNIGIALSDQERYEQAIPYFREAILLKPEEASFWTNRGVAEYHLEQLPQAILSFLKALDLDSHDADTQYYLGMSLLETEQFDEADRRFRSASLRFTQDPRFPYGRGVIAYELDNFERAVRHFEHAFQLGLIESEAVTEALLYAGYSYYKLGKYGKALDALEDALSLDPDLTEAQEYLERVQLHLDSSD